MALWGKNLTDEEYPIGGNGEFPHAARSVIYGEESTFGIDLIYNFE